MLNEEKYKGFIKTIVTYDSDSNYELFRDGLINIFNERQWFYILKGMLRFSKSQHKASYEKDITEFITTHS